ncbi:hydroxyethylthiazole kinase [Mariniluteicoccus endophyticus]
MDDVLGAVRDRRPLVHCLTAAVSMNFVADALLAAGARPMMTETLEEAPVVVGAAQALLVNLGTLSTDGMTGIPATVRAARERGLPWVLDPAAVGLPPVRTAMARELLASGPSVVRGNASEILVLADDGRGGSGPDATDSVEAAEAGARCLAERHGCVVAVSGPTDLVVAPGRPTATLIGGEPMLTRVTGTGCALGALVAACCAVAEPEVAARTASAWMSRAAERAAARASGPGSFKIELLDALAGLQDLTDDVGER